MNLTKKDMYKVIGLLGEVTASVENIERATDLIGEENYSLVLNLAVKSNVGIAESLFSFLLEENEIEAIEEYFEVDIGGSKLTNTILDPYAKNGEWLSTFSKGLKYSNMFSSKKLLIGFEENEESFTHLKSLNELTECYGSKEEGFEKIPKNSISLLLFNPYVNTSEVDFLYELSNIVESELLHISSEGTNNGKVVMTISKDDLVANLDYLTKHFNFDFEKTFVSENGYYIVFLEVLKDKEHSKDSKEEIVDRIINTNIDNVEAVSMYGVRLPHIPYEILKENHELAMNETVRVSNSKNGLWSWAKQRTGTGANNKNKIKKPTPLKIGEVANIISSGMIDGEMALSNGEGYHIVSGGTKEQVRQSLIEEVNRKGEQVFKTKTIVYSQPYLNVLINKNGKLTIKELQGGSDL